MVLSGAVARVGTPNWLREVEMVFNGIDAILKAPPTKPCTPFIAVVAAAGASAPAGAAGAAPLTAVEVDAPPVNGNKRKAIRLES